MYTETMIEWAASVEAARITADPTAPVDPEEDFEGIEVRIVTGNDTLVLRGSERNVEYLLRNLRASLQDCGVTA